MTLLLDTQCWLWWFSQPERLSEEAIKQSQIEGMTLVSADSMFDRYDVSVIWAAS